MAERIGHFLLVFDHEQGRLIETLKFGQDADAAVAAYAAKEAEYGDEKLIEVVLVGSDSFETVKLDRCELLRQYRQRLEVPSWK